MQKNENLITALYERLSRDDDQQGDSNSIVNQKSYLTAYAADHGFAHCRHYTDDGYSGGNFERPGWKRLIADIDAGFVNSVTVVAVALVLVTLLSAMGAYVFARLCVNWSKPAYSIVVACMSIPIHITLLPVFIMMRDAGLYNTVWALIPTYVTFYLPISIFIMTGYMKGISREIEEAALIDGASLFKIFYQIILPLSAPGLATICIYDAIYFWNEFSFALVLTQDATARTIPLAVWDFKAEYDVDTAGIMAVLTLSAVPLIIVYAFAQEKLVKGLMAGAVKG